MSAVEDERWSETEVEIMEATFAALGRHGYADLTLRKIAAEFEKSRSLIYYHYRTKEELFAALIQYLIDRYEERMALEDVEDPVVRLDRYVDTGLFGPDDPAFDHWAFHAALLEFRVQANHNESLRPAIEESYERVLDIVAAIVEDGIERGAFREVDPRTAAKLIVGIVDAARTLRIVGVDETAPETFREALDEFVLPRLYAEG
jgi:AcrR family transcriptional regulator